MNQNGSFWSILVHFGLANDKHFRRVPPCAVQTRAVRPVFARVLGELRAADPSECPRAHEGNASPGEQSEAPRRRWTPGPEQHPGQETPGRSAHAESTQGVLQMLKSHSEYPSDTKLLLTKNYFEIIIFEKLRISRVISGKKSFFPGDLEGADSLKNSEKKNSQGIIFVKNFVSEGKVILTEMVVLTIVDHFGPAPSGSTAATPY